MSTVSEPKAVEPKRKRGHERVAVIVETAIGLFAAEGFRAVTMSDIAARSGTAIGSLYRFFPTKDALAQAIMDRYGTHLTDELEKVIAIAERSSAKEVAHALVAMMLGLQTERAAALVLADAREDGPLRREGIRRQMLEKLTAVLALIDRQPIPAGIDQRSWMLLYALKAVRQFDHDHPALSKRLVADACLLVEPLVAAGLTKRG
ncbi:TetR/AcrR family transcriptional regulator [Neorhizobium sp. NCHU2750]|uniref:TetR/AcrR family transcriptional regulator n=1 Tax=Neorhizobium sp. NCHU2750 TaxID=1825976 RepID=UPI000E74E676|nr:TetR family transcriptional regulator [Neorhizobium sp. NCHU2750]